MTAPVSGSGKKPGSGSGGKRPGSGDKRPGSGSGRNPGSGSGQRPQKAITWRLGMTKADREQTVAAGTDVLFKWIGTHNVFLLPNKAAYDACNFDQATELASSSVNEYTYKASAAGTFYFACKMRGHCHFGDQKLALTVARGSGSGKPARPTRAPPTTASPPTTMAKPLSQAGKACHPSSNKRTADSPGYVASLEVCTALCAAHEDCRSITYFSSHWCIHYSTACTNVVTQRTATAVTFQSAKSGLLGFVAAGFGKQCSGTGEVTLRASSNQAATLTKCLESCKQATACKSVTYFSNKWCSHFSTKCTTTSRISRSYSFTKLSSSSRRRLAKTTFNVTVILAGKASDLSSRVTDFASKGLLASLKKQGLCSDSKPCTASKPVVASVAAFLFGSGSGKRPGSGSGSGKKPGRPKSTTRVVNPYTTRPDTRATTTKPKACACPKIMRPACGKDGKTYNNACLAKCAGVEVTANAPCKQKPGSGSGSGGKRPGSGSGKRPGSGSGSGGKRPGSGSGSGG